MCLTCTIADGYLLCLQAIAELVKLPLLEELVKLLYLVADDEAERVMQQQAAGAAAGGQQQEATGAAAGVGEVSTSADVRAAGTTGEGPTKDSASRDGGGGVTSAAASSSVDPGLQRRVAEEQERVVLEEFLGIFTPVSMEPVLSVVSVSKQQGRRLISVRQQVGKGTDL
jgi:hypothetical protein